MKTKTRKATSWETDVVHHALSELLERWRKQPDISPVVLAQLDSLRSNVVVRVKQERVPR